MSSLNAEQPLADLADLVLNLGRLLRAETPPQGTVALTETERHVMRLVDLHHGITPSEIADRSRIGRTNVSAALRALEGKRMLQRVRRGGRAVEIFPEPFARQNLDLLRTRWATLLEPLVEADARDVATTIALLADIEAKLISNRT